MNDAEAKAILERELRGFRSRPYSDLAELLGQPVTTEVRAQSGVTYQVEIQVFWDNRPREALRIMGSVDDGGLRAFAPLTGSFILAPDGSFVDE